MQKAIIFGIIALLLGAGGFLLWRAQTAEFPPEEPDAAADESQPEAEAPSNLGTEIMDEPDVVFDLAARNFAFSETELRVREGDIVRIDFTSDMGEHTFVLDAFGVATPEVPAGETVSVTFVADRSGEFEYYCAIGQHHRLGMTGTLIVEQAAIDIEAGSEIETEAEANGAVGAPLE